MSCKHCAHAMDDHKVGLKAIGACTVCDCAGPGAAKDQGKKGRSDG